MNSSTGSSNASAYDDIGGVAYLQANMASVLPYAIINCVEVVIGVFGNLLIICSILSSPEMRRSNTNILILNLAMADFSVSSILVTFMLVGVFAGSAFFAVHFVLCQLAAAVCTIVCVSSLVNIAMLAFNRYIQICRPQLYRRFFTRRNTIGVCVAGWLIGVGFDLPNLLGWGGHYFDAKSLMCTWNRLKTQSFRVFFPLATILTPPVLVLICYIRIFAFISANQSTTTLGNHKNQKSVKVAKILFLSFMIFVLCWAPYGLVVLTDFYNTYPKEAYLYTTAVGHFYSAFNPIFYGLFNPQFKRAYVQFLGKWLPIKASSAEAESKSAMSTAVSNIALARKRSSVISGVADQH